MTWVIAMTGWDWIIAYSFLGIALVGIILLWLYDRHITRGPDYPYQEKRVYPKDVGNSRERRTETRE